MEAVLSLQVVHPKLELDINYRPTSTQALGPEPATDIMKTLPGIRAESTPDPVVIMVLKAIRTTPVENSTYARLCGCGCGGVWLEHTCIMGLFVQGYP